MESATNPKRARTDEGQVSKTTDTMRTTFKPHLIPPRFDGRTSFSDFTRNLNAYLNASHATQEDALRLFPALLDSHDTKDAYDRIPAKTREQGPFEKMLDQMKANLLEFEDSFSSFDSFVNTKQGTLSVSQYAKLCQERADMAYNTKSPLKEPNMLAVFTNGLREPIRKEVVKTAPVKYSDAVRTARLEEGRQQRATDQLSEISQAIHNLSGQVNALNFRPYPPNNRNWQRRDRNESRPYRDRGFNYSRSPSPHAYAPRRETTPDRRVRFRDRSSNFRRYVNLLFIATISMAYTSVNGNSTFYDCSTSTSHGIISRAPRLIDCAAKIEAPIITTTIQLFQKNDSTTHRRTAFRCAKRTLTFQFTSLLYHPYLEFIEQSHATTTVEECWRVIRSQRFEGKQLQNMSHTTQSSSQPTPEANSFYYSKIENHTAYYITTGEITSFSDDSVLSSLLLNVHGCKIRDSHCQEEEDIIVWEHSLSNPSCQYENMGNFLTYIHDNIVLIPSRKTIHHLIQNHINYTTRCSDHNLFETTEGDLLTFTQYPRLQHLSELRASTSQTARQPHDLPSYHEYHASNQADEKRTFSREYSTACQSQNDKIYIWRALISINPTQAIRAATGRNDILARYIGSSLIHIYSCQEVIANKIFYNHRIDNVCYLETPALLQNGSIGFIKPATMEIVLHGTQTHCPVTNPNTNHTGLTSLFGAVEPHSELKVPKSKGGTREHYRANRSILTELATSLIIQPLQAIKSDQNDSTIDDFISSTIEESTDILNKMGKTVAMSLEQGIQATSEFINTGWNEVLRFLDIWKWIIGIAIGTVFSITLLSLYVYMCGCPRFRSTPPPRVTIIHPDDCSEAEDDTTSTYSTSTRRQLGYTKLFTYVPIILPAICAASTIHRSLPVIPVQLEDRIFAALWDSGASISIIQESTIHYLGLKNIQKCRTTARAANGSTIPFIGSTHIDVTIANVYLRHTFFITTDNNCPTPILIGIDFMKALEANGYQTRLSPLQRTLTVGTTTIPLLDNTNKLFKPTNETFLVRLSKSTHIPPHKHTTLVLTVTDIPHGTTVQLASNSAKALQFQPTILQPTGTHTVLRVFNQSANNISIQAGTIVGEARKLTPNSPEGTYNPYPSPETDWEDRLPQFKQNFISDLDTRSADLSPQQRIALKKIILQHANAFFNGDNNIGEFTGPIQHTIPLIENATLPKPRIYRIPLGKQEEVDRQVTEMLKQNIIEPSTSTILSPIVLVKKKDNSFRFTTDFRALNAVTKKQTYLIPNINDIIDMAAGANFFTNLDLISGFFQIPLQKEDRYLTAFSTTNGTYHYKRMPMGLCGAPHTFQSVVRHLQLQAKCRLFVYLDDLLIISETAEQHLRDIAEVLQIITNAGMKIKLKKCVFATKEVKFLGLLVGRDGVKPNPQKVEAVTNYPQPTNAASTRAFLGMTNYFRRFIHNYAKIAAPLHDLTKVDTSFNWTAAHDTAFQTLKKTLTSAPVLKPPLPHQPFIIESDGSMIAIGAVLLQKQPDGNTHPIAFASRKLNSAERKYPPIEVEALGIVFAVEQFRTYILGTHTNIITDHRPLTSLLHRRDLIGRLGKFQIILQEFDIEINYRPGKLNSVCDALSRYIGNEQNTPGISKPLTNVNTISLEEIKEAQDTDEYIKTIKTSLPLSGDGTHVLQNKILYVKPKEEHLPNIIVIPQNEDLISKIITHFHTDPFLAGHKGIHRTLATIRRRFTWKKMRDDVTRIVNKCLVCRRRKTSSHDNTVQPLGHFNTPSQPFERVHVDILGPLPVTTNQSRYILSMQDSFTKWAIARPLGKQDADEVIANLLNHLINPHGPPRLIITDNGSTFLSKAFQETLEMLGIEHNTSLPYQKNTNGQVERLHRTLEEGLTAYSNTTQTDWDGYLQFLVYSYNTTTHSTTGFSPFFLLFGREARIPEDNELKTHIPGQESIPSYAKTLTTRLRASWKINKGNIQTAAEKQKIEYDSRHRTHNREIKEGDFIMIRRGPAKNKLSPRWEGPYQTRTVEGNKITLQDETRKIIQVHKDHARRWSSPDEEEAKIPVPEEQIITRKRRVRQTEPQRTNQTRTRYMTRAQSSTGKGGC